MREDVLEPAHDADTHLLVGLGSYLGVGAHDESASTSEQRVAAAR